MDEADEDAFACFDSSDDDESDTDQAEIAIEANEHRGGPRKQERITRDPGNGVLAFHAGTEVALLHHVKTEWVKLSSSDQSNPAKHETHEGTSGVATEIIRKAETVLGLVDTYCMFRHWMMHVGPEKAKPLRQFISDCLIEKERKSKGDSVTFVELGTYCGYSSIFIAKTILEHYWNRKIKATVDSNFSFHIYSVEVVERFAAVAKELIELAGLEEYISVILVKDPDEISAARRKGQGEGSSLSSELQRRMTVRNNCGENSEGAIDFLFVDHDKSLYLPNLQELERARMVREGTYVAADNVVFAQIDDYRQYLKGLADDGIVTTRLEENLFVEYCQAELIELQSSSNTTTCDKSENTDDKNVSTATKDMLRDGIEFSVYLRDP